VNRHSLTERFAGGINVVVLLVIAGLMVLPFVYIFAVSFSSFQDFVESDLILWPKSWVTNAYTYILQSDAFIRSISVSVTITVLGTLVNLLFSFTMAYALTRKLPIQKTVMFMVLLTLLFPPGMIPVYLVVKETGLINSIWSLILPVAISPFNLIIIRQFIAAIPAELNEAAFIDGANELQTLRQIVLPLSKPVLAAFGLFYAVAHWNNYFSAILYLNTPEKWPIQVVLRQIVIVNEPSATLGARAQMLMENPPPPVTIQMAAILLATVPILIVYPFLQKHFTKGVMLGSIKG
jgi:putative aldouronate transport system permease protein